ncbi:MAG: hypothetical protein VX872_02610, partial [Candidatus Thermoplasmatota archaeon]|nr:hypothetical protein [Candidatus Thermoplasmatota archaeon]
MISIVTHTLISVVHVTIETRRTVTACGTITSTRFLRTTRGGIHNSCALECTLTRARDTILNLCARGVIPACVHRTESRIRACTSNTRQRRTVLSFIGYVSIVATTHV